MTKTFCEPPINHCDDAHHNDAGVGTIETQPALWPLRVEGDMGIWEQVAAQIHAWQIAQDLMPTQITVVLPFVQLIAPLRRGWSNNLGDGFLPRLETTQTWSVRIGGIHRAGAGPSMDSILDHLQAKTWLQRLGEEHTPELANALVEPLVNMATELMQAAGCIPPNERGDYWEKAQHIARQIPPGVAGVEAALGPLSVAWAQATEQWQTDVLFEMAGASCAIAAQSNQMGLVIVQAGGEDLLTKNLYQSWSPQHRLWLNLDEFEGSCAVKPLSNKVQDQNHPTTSTDPLAVIALKQSPNWQKASDAEDEAQRAAAQVISLLNAGTVPVALCSQDRPIARRVWALLNRQNIPMADETGWTLSTTHSAALTMGLVKAALFEATSDDILDAFKALPDNAVFTRGLDVLEKYLRQTSIAKWPQKISEKWLFAAKKVLLRINELLVELQGQGHRTLWQHLQALEHALKKSTAWSVLLSDVAGREVLQTLHLHGLHQHETNNHSEAAIESEFAQSAQATSMSYLEFTQWVNHTLESVTFIPPAPEQPQVVLTPLARVMLRPFAAVVIPGCDDSRLTALPSLSGFWCEADRIELGLMSRQLWWQRLQAQWVQALRLPEVTLIWRTAEGSQPLGPASLVQRVIQQGQINSSTDAFDGLGNSGKDQRQTKAITPLPTFVPAPQPATRFPLHTLSASAYKTLRDCPYKFYAEYMLRIREHGELDGELTRRDYGNWLHAVLRQFHELRAQQQLLPDFDADVTLLEKCAQEHAQELDEAALIPWQARWPALRDAYLQWLHPYEREGGNFVRAEFGMQYALSDEITLQGRIDRMDQQNGIPVFIDYKTERRSITEARVREAYEDVQLPFYALLAQGSINEDPDAYIPKTEQAKAIYLSLDDREDSTKAIVQDALQEVKVLLAQSILHDIQRLKEGFPAYPIGQARTCTYCAVKGLCRKDFWTEPLDDEEQESDKRGQV